MRNELLHLRDPVCLCTLASKNEKKTILPSNSSYNIKKIYTFTNVTLIIYLAVRKIEVN